MIKIEPTVTITIGNQVIPVADLPANIQELTHYYDQWRIKSNQYKEDMFMAQSAVNEVLGQLRAATAKWHQDQQAQSAASANLELSTEDRPDQGPL